MRIRWTPPAADDFENIKRYLELNYPAHAESTVRTIYRQIRSLKVMPNRGRPGLRTGTKELVLTPLPYFVVYSMKEDAIVILHIGHGAQDWR